MWNWFLTRWNAKAASTAEEFYDAVRRNEGERRVGGVNIVGNNLFRDQVEESIARLEKDHPFGYSMVRRYIRGVAAVPKPISFRYLTGLCFEVPDENGGLPWSIDRFAGVLLRAAVYARLARGHKVCLWLSSRAQLPALRQELRCLRLLGCSSNYIAQQEEFVEKKARGVK